MISNMFDISREVFVLVIYLLFEVLLIASITIIHVNVLLVALAKSIIKKTVQSRVLVLEHK